MESVSVIIPTFNSKRTLRACLRSIAIQNYPQNQIETIIVDGNSTDNTLEIARLFRTSIITDSSKSPESAKAKALTHASHNYILFLPSDNVIPHKNWLQKMVDVLDSNKNVTAVYPRYYEWRKKDTPLTRYFALMGANDPVAWFLGKADRESFLNVSNTSPVAIKTFTEQNAPTLGDNGFLVRRRHLNKADLKHFYHMDMCLDLISKGHNRFASLNESIIHNSGDQLIPFLKKKYRYFTTLYLKQKGNRRYHVYNSKTDKSRLALFILYSITLLGPLFHSSKGFMKKRDFAWFLHPLVCLGHVIMYSYAVCRNFFSFSTPK